MKAKVKGKDNLHDVIGFSQQSIPHEHSGLITTKLEYITIPVILIQPRGTLRVEAIPITDIEELHK